MGAKNSANWYIILTTLFHLEPSPRAVSFVAKVLLPMYGWPHQEAGKLYGETELSFRQTIGGLSASDRGFMIKIDRTEKKVLVSFDVTKVDPRHMEWLKSVKKRIGFEELNPQPYWGFDDLEYKAGTKLLNCFYVQADVKKDGGQEYYWYKRIMMLRKFSFKGFLLALERAKILVDFDARSGHNHGTKFRLRQNFLPMLCQEVTTIL